MTNEEAQPKRAEGRHAKTRPRGHTRKEGLYLRVPCNEVEAAEIKARADAAGLSVAAYLRNGGLARPITSIVDHQQVDRLLQVNRSLADLGNLLAMWLKDDPRIQRLRRRFPEAQIEGSIVAALEAIRSNQRLIKAIVARVVEARKA